ncbi:MAG: hypothetical protein ABL895_17935 [Cyclobacteriaceae bacterium]
MYKRSGLHTLILVIFLMTSINTPGQVRFSLAMGYGSYAMDDLKEIQEAINQTGIVDLQSLISFPPYYQYEGGMHYDFKNDFMTGLLVGYGSTGAHSNYSDYSGSITSDQLINYTSLTLSLGFVANPHKKWQFSLDLRPAVYFNALQLTFDQQIGTEKIHEEYDFKSRNITLQPTGMINRKFGAFGIHASVGFSINLKGGKLALTDNKDSYLINSSSDPAIADWSGFRLGMGINYSFSSKAMITK